MAVMKWWPSAKVVNESGVNVACPGVSSIAAVPKSTAPSLNLTDPSGMLSPLFAVTVAVKVGLFSPKALGLSEEFTVVVVAAVLTVGVFVLGLVLVRCL